MADSLIILKSNNDEMMKNDEKTKIMEKLKNISLNSERV